MNRLLKEGKVSVLLPENGGGGLSGEVHLIEHESKKYIVRKCLDIKTAKFYEFVSKELESKKVIPKLLGRYGKNVFYEFIKGRDLRKEEKPEIYYQLGKIAAQINEIKSNQNANKNIYRELDELESGKYIPSVKVEMRRKLSNIKKKPKKVLSPKEKEKILRLYHLLIKKTKPKTSLDITGFDPGNFRIRNDKVYLVDIEAIKPNFKGIGMIKLFMAWPSSQNKKKKFSEGYQSISKLDFMKEEYEDLCRLRFLIQALWFKAQVDRDNIEDLKLLEDLIKKYIH